MDSENKISWTYSEAVPSELEPGTKIENRLKVLSTVGRGQAGVVYRVFDSETQCFYALKLFRFRAVEQHRERLTREGQITASLAHPGIVRVYHLGCYDERPYILYEYIAGENLQEVLQQELSLQQRISYFSQIVTALAFAHDNSVVHRDLKPRNILVDRDHVIKIADFGLAWAPDSEALTATGCSVGTPRFMSPEQLRGESRGRDFRADVWSFGVMLYYALSGNYPYLGNHLSALASNVEKIPLLRLDEVNPKIPASLSQLCHRCLERDPRLRFQSAIGLLRAWRSGLHGIMD
jgi:eukaryotic-like serine/threonine-protein kinase